MLLTVVSQPQRSLAKGPILTTSLHKDYSGLMDTDCPYLPNTNLLQKKLLVSLKDSAKHLDFLSEVINGDGQFNFIPYN